MFGDLDDIGTITEDEVKETTSNNHGGNGYNGGGNGYNRGGKGGWNKYPRKEENVEDTIPYNPVSVFVDKDFPGEVKDRLYTLITKLLAKNYTVRVNGDDKEFVERIKPLSSKLIEFYIPWKKFNDIDSKFYYNSKTLEFITKSNFSGWDKVPDAVKALLTRNTRMIFGANNNSITMCLVTWSPDGATKVGETSKETGRSSYIIELASKHHFPVINIQKQGSEDMLIKHLEL